MIKGQEFKRVRGTYDKGWREKLKGIMMYLYSTIKNETFIKGESNIWTE